MAESLGTMVLGARIRQNDLFLVKLLHAENRGTYFEEYLYVVKCNVKVKGVPRGGKNCLKSRIA